MEDRKDRIMSMLLRLVATRSDTNSVYERVIEELLLSWLRASPYFQEHPDLMGASLLPDDQHERAVVWALCKGKGPRTIVLLHHHDAVGIDDYGNYKEFALRPDELKERLKEQKFSKGIQADLNSEHWLFGRGTGDMKAGAAIQLALLEDFCEQDEPVGNLLLVSVPDEEALSRGMLAATRLLNDLQQSHNLSYVLTINSEPYFNQIKEKAIMYEGSVGKIMPVVYVKGVRSHISDPYNGINPSLILAYIQQLTELNVELCDHIGDNATPPPVWVNQKDRKRAYDASIPDAASGYFNWLTFTKPPAHIMKSLKVICRKALNNVLVQLQNSWQDFCLLTDDTPEPLDIEGRVIDYRTLYEMAEQKGGERFKELFAEQEELIKIQLNKNKLVLPEATLSLIEFIADYIDLAGPTIILGLSGPYYPHVTNVLIPDGQRYDLAERVNRIASENFGVTYESQAYFMGISDLSYASWVGNDQDISIIKENSPGWDTLYKIPFSALKNLQMPVVNIGPWAKDLHKVSERVYLPDVVEQIPFIISTIIQDILAADF
ncbi:MAG: M20/M25/M40 family metallo-hydrolase [Spirochaetes bacterium]|nr:M20/M25/M40 family metallo-hydrolase [Spirochaetota bacterium]MBU0955351.1 M20/M25/M40 family metallo-hydrolase [Spirochaetota bacterium]